SGAAASSDPAVNTLRDSTYWVKSAEFPTGGKKIMARFLESRAARSCLAPKPLVVSANATVRSSRVLARLWVMSRMRKFSKVPWRKGGCSAPRQSTTICQRLSTLGTLVHREGAPTRPHCSGKSSCLIHEETWEGSSALYGTTHVLRMRLSRPAL